MIVKELITLLGVKTDTASMARAEGGINRLIGFAKAAAGAFAAIKVGQWAKGIAEDVAKIGDDFDKMSKRIGVSTDALQKFSHVSGLSGSSIGEMEVAIRRLQLSVDQAGQGSKTAREGFKRLGVDVKEANGQYKNAETLIVEMADGFQRLEDSTLKTALAQQLLGRSGTSLIPMLEQGSEAIKEQMQEVIELRGVMNEALIKDSTEYIDNQGRIELAFQGVKNTIGSELIPVLVELQEGIIERFKNNADVIHDTIGTAFESLGRIVRNVSSFFGNFASNIADVYAMFDPLTKRVMKLVGLFGVLTAIALLPGGSILLVSALMLALIDDFETWRKGGKSAIGEVIKAFEELLGIDFKKQDISDALDGLAQFIFDSGQDSTKAWQDLWEATLLVLEGYFEDFWGWVTERSGEYWGPKIKEQIGGFQTWLKQSWGGYWGPLFDDIYGEAENTWEKIKTSFLNFIDEIVEHFKTDVIDSISQGVEDAFSFDGIKNFFGMGDEEAGMNLSGGGVASAILQPTAWVGSRGQFRAETAPVEVNLSNDATITVNGGNKDDAREIAERVSEHVKNTMELERRMALKEFSSMRGE